MKPKKKLYIKFMNKIYQKLEISLIIINSMTYYINLKVFKFIRRKKYKTLNIFLSKFRCIF